MFMVYSSTQDQQFNIATYKSTLLLSVHWYLFLHSMLTASLLAQFALSIVYNVLLRMHQGS